MSSVHWMQSCGKGYANSKFIIARALYRRAAFLHRSRRFEAVGVAEDRSHRQRLAVELVFKQAIVRRDLAMHDDLIPLFRMADIIDRNIVMLAPEERHGVECFARAQHIARGHLSLALGHNPMLDTYVRALMRVRPARDVARGIDSRRAGLQYSVDDNATVDVKPGLLRK